MKICPHCKQSLSSPAEGCPHCEISLGSLHFVEEGIRLFEEGEYAGALKQFQGALTLSPDNKRLKVDCAHCFLHLGQLDQAYDLYEQAEQAGYSPPELKYNKALILLGKKKLEEAEQLLELLLGRGKLDGFEPGSFYLGLFFSAQALLQAEINFYLGLIHKERAKTRTAAHHLEEALRLNSHHFSALHTLAELYLESKQYSRAIERYTELINLAPLSERLLEIHASLGIAYFEAGELDDAMQQFNWVLQRSPGNPQAIHYLNKIYEHKGILKDLSKFGSSEVASPLFSLSRGSQEIEESGQTMIVGKSKAMQRVMRYARLAAVSDATVLLTGENGTGKEMLAKVIYHYSPRYDKPFVVVNCATIPGTLLESELFGHEKGAFTDAVAAKPGKFELADKGTIFLDEIAEISPQLQVKLLRVIQEKEFTRLGGTKTIRVDVRILAATNRILEQLIEQGNFREDLYYRLNVLNIRIPPLRERKEDIPLLVEYFLRKYCSLYARNYRPLDPDDLEALMEHDWPGNIRELEHIIERAVIMGTQAGLFLEEIARLRRKAPLSQTKSPKQPESSEELTLEDLERQHILAVLKRVGGNRRRAAELLGINPSTLWRKLKHYGI